MPSYLELTDLRLSDEPRRGEIILPDRAAVIGSDDKNNWMIARCHAYDICTHIFKVVSEERLDILDGKPVTETGDEVELEMDQVVHQLEDGEHTEIGSADQLDSGLLVVANKLVIRHSVLMSADNGGVEFYH